MSSSTTPEVYQGSHDRPGCPQGHPDEHADDEQPFPSSSVCPPSRGLFSYRSQFLTDTHGEGIMNTIFDGYEEWCGDIQTRSTGSLISFETGDAVTYGLFNAQQRGTLIVNAGEKVYAGEVVGYTPTGEDITVNVCKTKHLDHPRFRQRRCTLRLVPVGGSAWRAAWKFCPRRAAGSHPKTLRIRKRASWTRISRMKAASKKNK